MPSVQEIRQLKEELEKLTAFVSEYGPAELMASKDWIFACNVSDALGWILGEIPTDHFKSDSYLNLEQLKDAAGDIETSTGKKLDDYE